MAEDKIVIKNSNTGAIIAGAAALVAVSGGIYLYSKMNKKSDYTIGKPVPIPTMGNVGDTITLTIPITSKSSQDEDVTVLFGIYEAGTGVLQRGALIQEQSKTVHIPQGQTVNAVFAHTASVGGPTNNNIAMRATGVGVFVDNKEVGNGRVDVDVFGVLIAGQTVAFRWGEVRASKSEVVLNDNVSITFSITSMCSTEQTIKVHAEVRQGGILGQGEEPVGIPFDPPAFLMRPNELKTFSWTYKAIGIADRGRTISVSSYIGAALTPSTTPSNPYSIGDAFQVVSSPTGTDVQFDELYVTGESSTTGGLVDVIVGKQVQLTAYITNNSPFVLETITALLNVTGNTLGSTQSYNIAPGAQVSFRFYWTPTAPQGNKNASIVIRSKGVQIAGKDYGNVMFCVIPKILTLNITNDGVINIQNDMGNPVIPYNINGQMGFKTGQTLQLKVPSDMIAKFSHFSGDTGIGNWYSSPLAIIMTQNRTITANFTEVEPPPPTTTFSIGLYYPRQDTAWWRVEHFNADHVMDFHSEFKRPGERVFVTNVSSSGNIGIARAAEDSTIVSTWYSPQMVIRDGEYFNFFDSSNQLQSAGV